MFSRTKDHSEANPAQGQMPKRSLKAAPSIISADLTVSGALSANGDIQVDGKVDGNITSGSLTVGEKALVQGDILAEEVIVRGKIVGTIRARKVQLCSTCHVEGDIFHQALAVETGAYFEGNCRHSDDPMKEGTPSARRSAPAAAERRPGAGPTPRPEPGSGVSAVGISTNGPRIPGSLLGRPAPMIARPPLRADRAEDAAPLGKGK